MAMPQIELLDQQTIDQIAAGEVVERPASVVKELVENAIDAGADTITVEIRDGGTSLIRVTDNGCGIDMEQIRRAFLRHSTSKIRTAEDLTGVRSLGFRGEALSSISAVAQTELITKPADQMLGCRYRIEGGREIGLEEIGAPNGTTILVKNLFYNTPVRKKFLKTAQTEAGYVATLVDHLALSRPDISFRLIMQGTMKRNTSGNGSLKDVIYSIYGRDAVANLMQIDEATDVISVSGFVGTPGLSRGNRTYEVFFVNGRAIESKILSSAVEEGYKGFLMQHRFPFAILNISLDGKKVDVNVHPRKQELRFSDPMAVHADLTKIIHDALKNHQLIPRVEPGMPEKKTAADENNKKPDRAEMKKRMPEPFEENRLAKIREAVKKDSPYEKKYPNRNTEQFVREPSCISQYQEATRRQAEETPKKQETNRQLVLDSIFSAPAKKQYRIIGQLFDTYWMIEYADELYMIDQHAAHEKVLFERTMRSFTERSFHAQQVQPPIILQLSVQEYDRFWRLREAFEKLGFEAEPFGDQTIAIRAIPADLYGLNGKDVFLSLIDDLSEISEKETPESVLEKVASMSCKAAVKGNSRLSDREIRHLLDELMELENPFFCPHGRPVIIAMTHAEIDKKFKRIL